MRSPTYLAHSIGEAAYLYSLAVPFLEARTQANGHIVFAFDNEVVPDRGWELGQQWRHSACSPVDPVTFVHAYRTFAAIRHRVQEQETDAAHDQRNAN